MFWLQNRGQSGSRYVHISSKHPSDAARALPVRHAPTSTTEDAKRALMAPPSLWPPPSKAGDSLSPESLSGTRGGPPVLV